MAARDGEEEGCGGCYGSAMSDTRQIDHDAALCAVKITLPGCDHAGDEVDRWVRAQLDRKASGGTHDERTVAIYEEHATV